MKAIPVVLIVWLHTYTYMNTYAQYENVWAFGVNAGIDFNYTPPRAIYTMLDHMPAEGSASISDVNGQLLFYTDGTTVWNRNHDTMLNGTNLTGLARNVTASTAQGALIIPMPGSLYEYYIFSLGCLECNYLGRLSYSIVDMSKNNGLGSVDNNRKSILLDNTFTEHMTAVAGDNCDIWLIGYSREARAFRSYNINRNGIDPNPVTSNTTKPIESTGVMDISPNRKKLAVTSKGGLSNLTLYDINTDQGSLSNPVVLLSGQPCYGTSFSPDNSKLYVTAKAPGNNLTGYMLKQFDLSSGNEITILNSLTDITDGVWLVEPSIKRAPNGKIYTVNHERSQTPHMGVIHQPDFTGKACDFVYNGLPLLPGTQSHIGLPNTNSAIFEHYTQNYSFTLVCNRDTLSALNQSGINYMWEDGTSGAIRVVDRPGIYWVKYSAAGTKCVETYIDTFKVMNMPWGNYSTSTSLEACWQDTIRLWASYTEGVNHKWEDSSTGNERISVQSGVYWVNYHEPGNECKNYTDSFFVYIPDENFSVRIDTDSFACQNQYISFNNTSPSYYNQFTWYWGNGDTSTKRSPEYTYRHAGTYEILLTGNHNGICPDTIRKTIIVDTQLVTFFELYPPAVCAGQSVTIAHQLTDVSVQNIEWQYGDGNEAIRVDTILQHAYDRNGTMHITLNATYRACPDMSYTDSVIVYPIPLVDLGGRLHLCLSGLPITVQNLQGHKEHYRYLWNTGDTTRELKVVHPGNYILTITNRHGCVNMETVSVSNDCYTDIPNAFTPNGDGVNDYFYPRQLLSRGVSGFRMQIFNRWGQLLFDTVSADGRGWDGRLNGKEQPGGVYLYRIDVVMKNGRQERYEGNITLLR